MDTSCGTKTTGKQRMSMVWKYFKFEADDPTKVSCQVCSERLKFSGSTTSMKYHLRRHSSVIGIDIKLPPSKLKNGTSGGTTLSLNKSLGDTATSSSTAVGESRQDTITAHIISLLALDYHHPSLVEGEGFRAVFRYFDPAYTVPSAQTLSRRISLMHEVYKYRLASELGDSREVALGIEKWSSSGHDPVTYVTSTVHYITPGWEFRARVLGTEPTDEKSPNESSVTDVIIGLCKAYSIAETSVVAAVHENDQEVQLSCALLGWHHFPCFAQTLSNCVNGAFAIIEVAEMVTACRNLLECLLANPPLGAIFELRQKELGLHNHTSNRLQTDHVYAGDHDHWAATWRMMDFVHEQRAALVQTLQDPMGIIDNIAIIQLPCLPEPEEWSKVKAIVDALRPLETVRKILCAESHVSLSTVVPILFSLVSVHLQPTSTDKDFIKSLKNVMVAEMKAQFSFDSAAFTESFGIMATVLDPRHKSLPFLNDVQRKIVKTKLATLVEDNRSTNMLVSSDSESSEAAASSGGVKEESDEDRTRALNKPMPTVAEFLSAIYECRSSNISDSKTVQSSRSNQISEDIRNEVETYMLEESAPLAANPLDWWKLHSVKYPMLSKLARRMLCIPATAVRPSQAFAADVHLSTTRRRAALDSEFVDKLVFLNGSLQDGIMPTTEKDTQLMHNLACFAQAADLNSTDVVIGIP